MMTESRIQFLYHVGLLVLLLALLYGGTLRNGFVYDDKPIIAENHRLASLASIPGFFLLEDRMNESASTGYYRPLAYCSFAIDRAVWGRNPAGFTLTNILLHMATVLLLYAVMRELACTPLPSLWGALLFGLHPLANEVVNFHAGGRNTLLCGCFMLLSLLCHLRGRRGLSLVAFTLAIFSKEFALLLPVLLLMHDRLCRRQRPELRRYLPYLGPMIIYFALRAAAVQKANVFAMLHLTEELWLAPCFLVRYLWHMLFPFRLRLLYDVTPDPLAGSACLALLAVAAILLYRIRRHGDILFAAAWIGLFLLPVINIVPIPAASWLADRYAYCSLMGFALLAAALLGRLARRRAAAGMVLAACLAFMATGYQRNRFWRDDEHYFRQVIADAPRLYNGYQSLGFYYELKGPSAIKKAIEYYALAADKRGMYPEYLVNNAALFVEQGRPDLAETSLQQAIALEPGNPEQRLMLATLYEEAGEKEEARAAREEARKIAPDIEQKMAERSVIMCRAAEQSMAGGHQRRAVLLLRRILMITPRYVPALIDLGSIRAEQGDLRLAVTYWERALSIEPENSAARHNLAELRRMQPSSATPSPAGR